MIYVIAERTDWRKDWLRRAETVVVKVGYTAASSCKSRCAHLQIGNPRFLEIVAELDGDLSGEKALHAVFGPWRVRRNGEWFHLDPHRVRVATFKRVTTASAWLAEMSKLSNRRAQDQRLPECAHGHASLTDAAVEIFELEKRVEMARAQLGEARDVGYREGFAVAHGLRNRSRDHTIGRPDAQPTVSHDHL